MLTDIVHFVHYTPLGCRYNTKCTLLQLNVCLFYSCVVFFQVCQLPELKTKILSFVPADVSSVVWLSKFPIFVDPWMSFTKIPKGNIWCPCGYGESTVSGDESKWLNPITCDKFLLSKFCYEVEKLFTIILYKQSLFKEGTLVYTYSGKLALYP